MNRKNLPEGWRWVNLGDLGETRMGGTPKTNVSKYWDREEVIWITPEDMQEGYVNFIFQSRRMISHVGLEESSTKLLPPDSVILSTTASIGKVGIAQVPLATNQQLTGIVTNHLVNPIFLAYYLLHLGNDGLANLGGTTTATHINQGSLRKLDIPLPPLPVQERIVQILQKAGEIRRKQREALELADKILPALFLEMFGDPATNPKGWDTVVLGDVLKLIRNGTTAPQNIQKMGYPVSRIETISHGVINPEKVRWVELDQSQFEKWRLEHGDILFSHINSVEHIGKTAIYLGSPPNLVHGMNLLLLRADPTRCLPIYLFLYLRLPSVREKLQSMARQAVNQASLNQTQLKSFPIMLPPLELQGKLAMAVDQHHVGLFRLAMMEEEGALLFENLVSRAFTGELTAEWEAANAEWIAAEEALHERLPRLLVLALLTEKAKRARRAAPEILVTALMKYAFLFQMEGNGARRRLYHFVPYHYGPFAKELYADLQALQDEGLVRMESDPEEDKTKITLGDPAKAEEALAELPDDLKEDAVTIIETYGDLDHNALLRAVYEKYPAYARKSRLKRGKTRK